GRMFSPLVAGLGLLTRYQYFKCSESPAYGKFFVVRCHSSVTPACGTRGERGLIR
ncbi:hypothetical protein J6590_098019, partial [Homalodisca vitripennis]